MAGLNLRLDADLRLAGYSPPMTSLSLHQPALDYRLIDIADGEQPFLRKLFDAFGFRTLRAWVERGQEGFDRQACDGLVTALGECDGRTVAVVWSDFRVKGSSYGRLNSRRFTAFLRYLRESPGAIPLVYVINSAGVSLMEGRSAFSDAFELWPELLQHAQQRLLLTCAVGKCLGLAPLLFGLGHYRVAVAGATHINLTGPEVMRLFFGAGADFQTRAAAERCLDSHDLVHEVVPSLEAALGLFRGLISQVCGPPPDLGVRTGPLLLRFLDRAPREVVPGWCPRVRLFIGTRRGRPLGVFVNPLERSNNMITVRTLDKYAAGLDLFRALRLPIVSILDSPGIDPRCDQSDANNIRRILWAGEKIIHYPHGAMSVVAGRCFGGATALAIPKVFGGTRVVALRGAQFGVMHERIVEQVLSGSPRLLAEWRSAAAVQGPDLSDLVLQGALDAVVDPVDLPAEIDRFLSTGASRPRLLVRRSPRSPREPRQRQRAVCQRQRAR